MKYWYMVLLRKKPDSKSQWVYANGYKEFFWGGENVLELDSGNSCTILTVLKPLNCTPQRVKFVV